MFFTCGIYQNRFDPAPLGTNNSRPTSSYPHGHGLRSCHCSFHLALFVSSNKRINYWLWSSIPFLWRFSRFDWIYTERTFSLWMTFYDWQHFCMAQCHVCIHSFHILTFNWTYLAVFSTAPRQMDNRHGDNYYELVASTSSVMLFNHNVCNTQVRVAQTLHFFTEIT